MAIVVEDGTGLPNATSYASVNTADAYHARMGNPGWADKAASTVLHLGANPTDGDQIVLDEDTYTFKITPAANGHVKIGASVEATRVNLRHAINGTGVVGIHYFDGGPPPDRTPHPTMRAGSWSGDSLTISAIVPGTSGNGLGSTWTFASASNYFDAGETSGGEDLKEIALQRATAYADAQLGERWLGSRKKGPEQSLDWPRVGAEYADGHAVDEDSLPQDLVDGICEIALVAIAGPLGVEEVGTDDASTQSETITVGPISISETLAGGGRPTSPSYPRGMRLLEKLATSSGEAIRG